MTSTLPDYPAAVARALESARRLEATDQVPLAEASGRVLRERVEADRDLPPFDRAQMDGYAVRAAELGGQASWPVTRTIAAGQPAGAAVPPGCCVAIATGAPVPEGVDTVVQHELSDRADPIRFTVDHMTPGHAIHPRGADARRGAALMAPGTVLAAQHLGIAAAVGRARLVVARRPRAIVLTSGDEVCAIDASPAAHHVRNSNAPQTLDLLRRIGADAIEHQHLVDDMETTIAGVGEALPRCDLLITIGGISAGDRDHFPDAFDAHGVTRSLHGAAIQPGRPVVVGRTPGGVVVVGLPGNPVSSLACACLFAWPIVRAMLGLDPTPPWREVEAATPVKPNPRRRAFRPARLDATGGVTVPAWAGSGDLAHTAGTDGLVELPVQTESVAVGTRLRFLPWP